MTILNIGSDRFDCLCSSRLYCVDCFINRDTNRLEAGWVYTDGLLQPKESLMSECGLLSIDIEIPTDLQLMEMPSTFYFSDEPVEFFLANEI